jgi:uncharacterized protein (DUF433 family)
LEERATKAEADPRLERSAGRMNRLRWWWRKFVYRLSAPYLDEHPPRRWVSNEDILGGDLCFEGTRLPVAHIGMIAAKGHYWDIFDDYPYLTLTDVMAAESYYRRSVK